MFGCVIRGSDAFRVAGKWWWGGCSDGKVTKWQKSELRHKTKSSVCRAIFEAICPQRIPKPQQGPYLTISFFNCFHFNTPQSYKVRVIWGHIVLNVKWLTTNPSTTLSVIGKWWWGWGYCWRRWCWWWEWYCWCLLADVASDRSGLCSADSARHPRLHLRQDQVCKYYLQVHHHHHHHHHRHRHHHYM